MDVNFKEALAVLYRALPVVLFRAGIFVAGGFMIIILFGVALFAFRLAGGSSQTVAMTITVLAILGWWVSGRVLQRFFLYRYRAAMLFLFSGCPAAAASSLATAIQEARRLFPDHSCWMVQNRSLRRALSAFFRSNGEFPVQPAAVPRKRFAKIIDLLTVRSLSQAVLALAFFRGGTDAGRSVREGLALYFRHGTESRRLARQWLWLTAAGLAFLFLCLALPNWVFFRSAGAPAWIGIALAAAIAWLLYQAFIVPFALAGLSAALLAETSGCDPDPALCEKIVPLPTP